MPESFLYFAYGSNMCTKRLVRRGGEVKKVAVGYITGRTLCFDKMSDDGSGKCDCARSKNDADKVYGVIFRVNTDRRDHLDELERGYVTEAVTINLIQENGVGTSRAADSEGNVIEKVLIYVADENKKSTLLRPYNWYKRLVLLGTKEHDLPAEYVSQIRAVSTQPYSRKLKDHPTQLIRAGLPSNPVLADDPLKEQRDGPSGQPSRRTVDPKQSAPAPTRDQEQVAPTAKAGSPRAPTQDNSNRQTTTTDSNQTVTLVANLGAEDCLTRAQMQQLRERARSMSLTDEVAEELSASLGLGQEIRAENLYIADAAARLDLIVEWLLAA